MISRVVFVAVIAAFAIAHGMAIELLLAAHQRIDSFDRQLQKIYAMEQLDCSNSGAPRMNGD